MICTCPGCQKRFEVSQPNLGLSEREAAALALIRHAAEEGRVAPSADEVAIAMGVRTRAAAEAAITKLAGLGFIAKQPTAKPKLKTQRAAA